VKYEIVNTTIFAPFGSPTKSFTTFVDLSNKDAIKIPKINGNLKLKGSQKI
jgi:hypothetical protein